MRLPGSSARNPAPSALHGTHAQFTSSRVAPAARPLAQAVRPGKPNLKLPILVFDVLLTEICPYVTVLMDADETGPLPEQSARSGGAFTPRRSTNGHSGNDDDASTSSAHTQPGTSISARASPPLLPTSPGYGFDGAGGSLYGCLLQRLAPLSPSLAALAPAHWGDVDAVVQALAADLQGGPGGAGLAPAASPTAAVSRLPVPLMPDSPPPPTQQQPGTPESPLHCLEAAAATAMAEKAAPPPPCASLSRQACELQGLAGDLVAVLRQAGDDIRRLRARRPRRPLLLLPRTAALLASSAGRSGGDGDAAPGERRRALSRSCSTRHGGGRTSASPARAPLRRAVSGRTREWGGGGFGGQGGAGTGTQAPRREQLLLRTSSRGASVRWAASAAPQAPAAALAPSLMSITSEMAPVSQPAIVVARSRDGSLRPARTTSKDGAAACTAATGVSRIPRPQGVVAQISAPSGGAKGAMSEAAAALAAAAAAAAAVQTHVQSLRDRRRETHGEDPAFAMARLVGRWCSPLFVHCVGA